MLSRYSTYSRLLLNFVSTLTSLLTCCRHGARRYLFNLRELYLFHNQLTGTIPESFVNLKNLRCLGVSNNKLRNVEETRELLEDEYGLKQNLQLS